MITALFASENIAMMEMRSGYSVLLPYASIGLMNSVFTISFFSLKVKISVMKVFRISFFKKWVFVGRKTLSLSLKV